MREESVVDYPDWATRELLMNAICHRDYTSHGPIQFYQFDDRIEIMNHGGLYGRANEENFPNVNDYRNIVVAEAMKVLGFVNRHSRGVLRVQKELVANEKPSKKPSKKRSNVKVPVFPSKIVEDVFKALKLNPKAKYSWLIDNLGVSESTVLRAINDLKELGYINSEHSKVKGVW